jgi:thioredoxin reductase
MSDADTQIAIIGAGPYGLALAAHLRAQGIEYRIFGVPMEAWITKMPKGMFLKSQGFASNLYDPDDAYTLKRFCGLHGLSYEDYGMPVALKTFCDYGLAFQRAFVPDVDQRMVAAVQRTASGYRLRLADGEDVRARNVVCAVGISHFHYTPLVLRGLPTDLVTHSSQHHLLDHFKGHDVTIIGAGASALDLAALLNQVGAAVRVIARRSRFAFGSLVRQPRPLWKRIRTPMSGLGEGWRSRLCTDAPLLFHWMPEWFRLEVVRRHLGPSPGWYLRDQVEGKVSLLTNADLVSAAEENGRIRLRVRYHDGAEHDLVTEHVIAATGYKVDLRRLAFLDRLRHNIHQVTNTPVLTSHFECSVPGLYFAGVAAANNFGPLLRFAFGARFAARRMSQHLRKSPVPLERRVWVERLSP